MTITFKDDSKEEFLVWNEDNNQIIITKDTNEKLTQGLILNKETPKMVTNLLSNLK